jgi:hypothetical protein
MLISLKDWDRFLVVNLETSAQMWFVVSAVDKQTEQLHDYSKMEFLQLWKPPSEGKVM